MEDSETFNTVFGGIISIVVVLLTGTYAGFRFTHVIGRKETNHIALNYDDGLDDDMILSNEKDGFNLAFGLYTPPEVRDKFNFRDDSELGNWSAQIWTLDKSDNLEE